jgi:uncharacterized protein YkwD
VPPSPPGYSSVVLILCPGSPSAEAPCTEASTTGGRYSGRLPTSESQAKTSSGQSRSFALEADGRKDYFSHNSYDGESVRARLGRFGYGKSVNGENIAGGYDAPAEPDSTFERWMDSAGHRANILDGRFRRVGVGTYAGNYDGTNGYIMYTVDFGV